MRSTPIVSVSHFKKETTASELYISSLKPHIKAHAITRIPHKHDFYFLVLFTKGKGVHEIDFIEYQVKPGDLFVMRPGQMHVWRLSDDAAGFVIIHSGAFYEEGLRLTNLSDYAHFAPFGSSPFMRLKKLQFKRVVAIMTDMLDEYSHNRKFKLEKIRTLLGGLYVEVARSETLSPVISGQRYFRKLVEFEKLLDEHFSQLHLPSEYARILGLSERHLNRITRSQLNKSSGDLIHEKLILEAKRRLSQSDEVIADVSESLGFSNPSYFSKFFTREVGMSPREFVRRVRVVARKPFVNQLWRLRD